MTSAVIVQARFASTRLPGKVLLPLGGRPELAIVLERCSRIPGIDVVVCAVPDGRDSDPVAEAARDVGALVVRGPEHDVLARYAQAARAVGAVRVMRVTSDCPLIDPELAGEVLAILSDQDIDYASNNMPPLWPHGLDCEAFRARDLFDAAAAANQAYDREHVTPWLRRNPNLRRATLVGPGGGLERHRWTLDHPDDYSLFAALWDAMGTHADRATTAEILEVLALRPDIAAINQGLVDEARLADRSNRPDRLVESRVPLATSRRRGKLSA